MNTQSPSPQAPQRGRGIYLLPNLFTTSALLAGFYAIVAAQNGDFQTSAISILIALVLDGFDGRVARMTNTTTAFGAEYDSMADMVSFGVAPAFLMYTWSLSNLPVSEYGQLGWVACFVYTGCCGLRLARFNVAVGTAASLVWVSTEFKAGGDELIPLALFATVTTGLLMVSTFMYYSFKDLGESRKIPFAMLVGVLLLMVFTAVDAPKMILIASTGYAAAGPAYALFRWLRKRNKRGLPRD